MALLKMISRKFNKIFTSQDDGTIIEENLKASDIATKEEDTEDEKDDDNTSIRKRKNKSNN